MLANTFNKSIFLRNLKSFMRLRIRYLSDDKNNSHVKTNDDSEESTSSSITSTHDSFKLSLDEAKSKQILKSVMHGTPSHVKDACPSGEWTTPVFSSVVKVDQASKSDRPKTDPKECSVVLFPGQGSQFVGMGRDVLDAPHVEQMFDISKKILGYDLLYLCLNGPQEHLNKTQYCQPAVFVTSLAAVERLRVTKPGQVESCIATAGFSVGELAALVFAGAISFEDGLRLVKIRAEAMQYTSEMIPSGMMTIFYKPDAKINFACKAAKEWCIRKGVEEEHAVCSIANYLFPHCKVIAGHEEALVFLELNAKDFGIRKCRRLPVSGAFHTKLMTPAKRVFREALKHIQIDDPLIPVHSNVDGKMYSNGHAIREKLVMQITSPVKWEQTMHIIYDRDKDVNVPNTFECGPGKSLLSILEMVNGVARRHALHVPV